MGLLMGQVIRPLILKWNFFQGTRVNLAPISVKGILMLSNTFKLRELKNPLKRMCLVPKPTSG